MARSKSDLLASLDAFTTAYITCALWSSTDNARDDGGDPLDRNYGPEDLTIATLREMIADCRSFQHDNAADLEGLDTEQCGHDFWLTRNGHGAGFWDRGLGALGDRLSDASKPYGSVDLTAYRGRIAS
jgi:hypothetical protein